MTLGEFIANYRKEHGKMSLRAFGSLVGMSAQAISNIEKGIGNNGKPTKPNITTYQKIADGLGISEIELMYMLSDEVIVNQSGLPDNVIPMPVMHRVPLLGQIACGQPITAEENFEGEVDVPDNITADFALRCKGDSMINARIFDGDLVYIHSQPIVENGQIAAVYVEDQETEATLKRIHLYDDHIVLEPENPMYKPMVFWGKDMNKVQIIGKAVAFTSMIR